VNLEKVESTVIIRRLFLINPRFLLIPASVTLLAWICVGQERAHDFSLCPYMNNETIFVGKVDKLSKVNSSNAAIVEVAVTQFLKNARPISKITLFTIPFADHLYVGREYLFFVRNDVQKRDEVGGAFPVVFVPARQISKIGEEESPQYQIAFTDFQTDKLDGYNIDLLIGEAKLRPKFSPGGISAVVFPKGVNASGRIDIPFPAEVLVLVGPTPNVQVDGNRTTVDYVLGGREHCQSRQVTI